MNTVLTPLAAWAGDRVGVADTAGDLPCGQGDQAEPTTGAAPRASGQHRLPASVTRERGMASTTPARPTDMLVINVIGLSDQG
jgi:hypothetical protein